MKNDLELLFYICFSELVYYPDENEDIFIEKTEFRNIRELLGIEIDIQNWIRQCEKILQGERNLRSISLFYSKNKENYILLENYFDPIDQLDFVHVGVKTTFKNSKALKELGRAFSDVCKYNIDYTEGNSSIFKFYPIDDEKLKRYNTKPLIDLSKGKLVRKIYNGKESLYNKIKSYYWRNNTLLNHNNKF